MNIEFIIASACLALLPGPDILFVLTQSIGRGFKAAFSVSLGLVSGLAFHTAAVALGVAALVAASPVLFHILKYLGAAYLVWLGAGVPFRSRPGSPFLGGIRRIVLFCALLPKGRHYECIKPESDYFLFILFSGVYP